MEQQTTYLSLGTNQGNRLENLQNAVYQIALRIGVIDKISSIYETDSWGFSGEKFYNICLKLNTALTPSELIKSLLEIEQDLGRIRTNSDGYSNRIIDIDVLFIDNQVIVSEELIVPHPHILERAFVLEPLNEIAEHYIHPTVQQSIKDCLSACSDETTVEKIDLKIERPIPFTEKYNYIAIEGNIGVGKTTLSTMISEQYNTKLILERFSDNPFLPKFYENQERYAFPLEMSFLADRYQQLSDDLAQFDLFKTSIISDYYIFKSLIFANVTLSEDEDILYRKMFDIMYKEITKPDLYIYLYQNTERLIQNIKKRGRIYEQSIEPKYLEQINKGYLTFIKTQRDLNILVIDVTNLDFLKNKEDYYYILDKINKHNI